MNRKPITVPIYLIWLHNTSVHIKRPWRMSRPVTKQPVYNTSPPVRYCLMTSLPLCIHWMMHTAEDLKYTNNRIVISTRGIDSEKCNMLLHLIFSQYKGHQLISLK